MRLSQSFVLKYNNPCVPTGLLNLLVVKDLNEIFREFREKLGNTDVCLRKMKLTIPKPNNGFQYNYCSLVN